MRDTRINQIKAKDRLLGLVLAGLDDRVSALDELDFDQAQPGFAKTVENGNVIRLGVQLKDAAGEDLDHRAVVRVFLSTSERAAASGVDTSAAAVSAGTILREEATRAMWTVETNAAGFFDLALGHSVAGTFFVHVIWYDRLYVAGSVTFA